MKFNKELEVVKIVDEVKPIPNLPVGSVNMEGKLPSKFIPYGEDVSVYVVPYTLGDMRKIANSNPEDATSASEASEKIISSYQTALDGIRMYDKTGNPLDTSILTFNDFLFCIFFRKVISIGSDSFNIIISDKQLKSAKPVTIEDIIFKDLEVKALPISLTTTHGDIFSFSPITIGKMLNYVRSEKQFPEYLDIFLMQLNCETEEELERFLQISNREDTEALGEITSYLDHGMRPLLVQAYKLDSEGEIMEKEGTIEVEVNLTDPANLVLPFRKDDGDRRAKISFG